jgi:ribonuclease P protein component
LLLKLVASNKKDPIPIIRLHRDYLRINKYGKRIRIKPWLIVLYVKNDKSISRVGWTVPKVVGSAVTRNRIKRVLRDFFRKHNVDIQPESVDINLIFRATPGFEFKNIDRNLINDAVTDAVKKLSIEHKK